MMSRERVQRVPRGGIPMGVSIEPAELLLYPDAEAPRRIADEVCAVLAALPFVRRVALFGSLADGRADRWSDIDMYAACDDVRACEWTAAAAILSAKPVLFYRKFSAVEQPSGRYWFAGESPFNRLDISFFSPEEYQSKLDNPEGLGYSITLSEVYSSDSHYCPADAAEPTHLVTPATEQETEIGSFIYFSLRAIKDHLRGAGVSERDVPRIAGLRRSLATLASDAVVGGGRIGELAHQVGEMLDQVSLV